MPTYLITTGTPGFSDLPTALEFEFEKLTNVTNCAFGLGGFKTAASFTI